MRHKYDIMVAQKVASYHDARPDQLPLRPLPEITAQQAGDVFPADRVGAVHLESEFRWNELTALVKIPLDQPPHHDNRGVIAA